MLITGQSLKVAMESGFSLTQIGEFAFIIATLGMSLGVLDSTIYPIVVAVSVLTTFTTPYFIRMADPAYNIVAKMLPRNLRFLINRYTTDAGTDAATNTLWQSVLRRYVWRILIYAAILITIVLLSKGWLLPMLTHFNEKWGRLICALVTLTAMSPFLFALAIPASKSSERRQLKNANSHSKVPLVVMTLFRLILALGFIVYELKSLYSWSTAVVCGIAVFILIALLLSNRIRMHLHNICLLYTSLVSKGRPVLVGTTSVEISELLSRMLTMRHIPHNVLNAKLHQKEAEIVALAGRPGTVTIATNMAGRGTDIKLPEDVKKAGGLAIIGTERHESRRVDRQLRGRSGRQGDPGSSVFYVSFEDQLMRIFASDRVMKMLDSLGLKEGEVIESKMVTRAIENAQKRVEENNFGIRKRLLEYDDVMNKQRTYIYARRCLLYTSRCV